MVLCSATFVVFGKLIKRIVVVPAAEIEFQNFILENTGANANRGSSVRS
jgi:hypothetical protein